MKVKRVELRLFGGTRHNENDVKWTGGVMVNLNSTYTMYILVYTSISDSENSISQSWYILSLYCVFSLYSVQYVMHCIGYVSQPVPKARWKCCVELRTTPSLRTGLIRLNHIASGHPLGPVKIHLKSKTSKRNQFFLGVQMRSAWNWWGKHRYTGIYARWHGFLFRQWTLMYHKWEPACLYAITMQDRKVMREKNIQPKIYWDEKTMPSEDKW